MEYDLKIYETNATLSNYRNFPSINIKITKTNKKDYPQPGYEYLADVDYSFWSPDNPIDPCRKTGHGKTRDEAVNMAIRFTFPEESDKYPNNQVFITDSNSDYKNAFFTDGNGNHLDYEKAKTIISNNSLLKNKY